MLSLSMAYKVIPCKQLKETLKKSKSPNLLYNFGSRFQKWPKIPPKKDHSIAICSIFYRYGIFYMIPGESSCQGGSKYVCQRWLEGDLGRVTCSRRWPSFQRNSLRFFKNKLHSHNFRKWANKLKSLLPITYGKKWFQFASSVSKIVGVRFILNTSYFC